MSKFWIYVKHHSSNTRLKTGGVTTTAQPGSWVPKVR